MAAPANPAAFFQLCSGLRAAGRVGRHGCYGSVRYGCRCLLFASRICFSVRCGLVLPRTSHLPPAPPPTPATHLPPTPATHLPPATHALAAAGGRNKSLMFCPPCASLLEKLVVMSCCRGELRGWMALRRSSQTPVAVQPCQALYHLLYWALGLGRTIAT